MSRLHFFVVLFSAVALSACQDPSGVGLGLVDDQLADPNVQTVLASLVDTVEVSVSTAGFAESGSTQPQTRVLVGRVRDAVYGDAAAIGYVDAKRPTTLPDGFTDSTVTYVRLELVRSYVYGDTTAVLPMQLRQVEGSWTPTGLSVDTTLGTGDLIQEFNLTASDTLLAIDLPAAWVAANGAQFTDDDFLSAFEGFALSVDSLVAPVPGAVVGFDLASASSRIRVGTRADTVSYTFSEVFTKLRRGVPPASPAGLLPLRAASPVGAKVTFDLSQTGALPLSRAIFRLPIDRSLSGNEGTFLRPLPTRVALYAVGDEGSDVLLGEVDIRSTGDPVSTASTALTNLVQDMLLGISLYDQFEVRLPISPVSLDVLPIVLHGLPDQSRPRLSLTVVGQPV